MTDTVELWTLRDENAELRRQLADSELLLGKGWQEAVSKAMHQDGTATGAAVIQCTKLAGDVAVLQEQLAEAQRQRDESQAACAALRNELEKRECSKLLHDKFPGTREQIEAEAEKRVNVISESGRDLLVRLEAAEDNRRLLATDLAALADHKDVKTILAEAVRLKLEAAQPQAADALAQACVVFLNWPPKDRHDISLEDTIETALAAYRATREQK